MDEVSDCPSCGKKNGALRGVCSWCGHDANAPSKNLRICPDCGTEISPAAVSCPKCGRPFKHQGGGLNLQDPVHLLGVAGIAVLVILALSGSCHG